MFLQKWTVSKENDEVCSIVMRQEASHPLCMTSKLNFLTLIPLSMIYSMLFAVANLHYKGPNFGAPTM
jgi:hypothetical protein